MPRKPISFELDFMVKDIFPRFTVKQFDDVSFNIKPKNQGLDYDTTGMTGKIFVGINNDMFMQTTGITVSSDNINVLLDKNMLQKNGRAYAEIELTDSAGTITSSSFIFDIDPKIGEGGQIPGEYEGFVEKYERLISEFKSQVSSTINNCNNKVNITINNCNTNVDNKLNSVDSLVNVKISDFEKRFNRLTSSQQQDAEVIDARVDFKGVAFDSLKERIDYTDKLLRDSTVSTVTTESDFTTVEATSNGYFEDVKLEGKTLVNLMPNSLTTSHFAVLYASISDNVVSFTANGTSRNLAMKMDSLNLKPSTKYTMIVEITKNTVVSSDKAFRFASNGIGRGDAYLTVIGGQTSIEVGEVGTRIIPMITREDGNYTTSLMGFVPTGATSGEISFKICLLEGDHTQNPPSFFEGLKSVGQSATTSEDTTDEIVVSSVNKYSDISTKSPDIDNHKIQNQLQIPITESFSIVNPYHNKVNVVVFKDGSWLKDIEIGFGCNYIKLLEGEVVTYFNQYFRNGWGSNDAKKIKNILISTHQDKKRLLYYNNETQMWEKPILRQWDSIEKHADGKYYYHQRSGEVVLNGSEGWIPQTSLEGFFRCATMYFVPTALKRESNAICDRFKTDVSLNADSKPYECVLNTTDKAYHFVISSSKLSTQDLAGFKTWLQANPTTVVYQLAEEKVYECTNIDLITYNGETNYVINCGAIVPKSTLKVHNNISNVVSLLQKKVSLLESNVKASQEVQDMMILESDIRILDIELALMEHMPIKLSLGENIMLRSATYFNFIKGHIVNETYSKDYLENVMNKYLATGRINKL